VLSRLVYESLENSRHCIFRGRSAQRREQVARLFDQVFFIGVRISVSVVKILGDPCKIIRRIRI
jgi:hypothetical protein